MESLAGTCALRGKLTLPVFHVGAEAARRPPAHMLTQQVHGNVGSYVLEAIAAAIGATIDERHSP